MDLIKSGQEEGACLKTGGSRKGDKGYFIESTVFTDVKDDMRIAKEDVNTVCRLYKSMKLDTERVQSLCHKQLF